MANFKNSSVSPSQSRDERKSVKNYIFGCNRIFKLFRGFNDFSSVDKGDESGNLTGVRVYVCVCVVKLTF